MHKVCDCRALLKRYDWAFCEARLPDWVRCEARLLDWAFCEARLPDWVRCEARLLDWAFCEARLPDWVRCEARLLDWARCEVQLLDWVFCEARLLQLEALELRPVLGADLEGEAFFGAAFGALLGEVLRTLVLGAALGATLGLVLRAPAFLGAEVEVRGLEVEVLVEVLVFLIVLAMFCISHLSTVVFPSISKLFFENIDILRLRHAVRNVKILLDNKCKIKCEFPGGVIFLSGHSKWNNIKRKKEKTDSQRAKTFTKVGREIAVAVREGGADPAANGKLRDVIAKAKAANVPSDNIERIIKKAQGGDRADYETILYEGYGPGGVAVMVESLTDNRNRTAADVRHYFDKYGGNLGTTGCVSFMFTQKGVIAIEMEGLDEDTVMEAALEAGAEDIAFEEGVGEITTAPGDLRTVRETLETMGYAFISAEIAYVPASYTRLEGEDNLKKMATLIEMLEDNDDIQNLWHNLENEEDLP